MTSRGVRAGRADEAVRQGGVFRPAVACVCALLVAGLTLLAGPVAPARAQQQTQENLLDRMVTAPVSNPADADPNKPMLLQADELQYDNQRNRVTASGNVEIYYKNYALQADRVIYDQGANTLTAEGNVRIKEPDGSILSADVITLTEDFRDGFVGSLKVVTKDDLRIAASSAKRQDGETTVFENGVFTPCKPCQDNPAAPPFWRIRADKITHKQSEANIYFQNAYLDFFGVPVAYVPFFYSPDPSVKRRSGFLAPSVSGSSDLGYTTEIPYFWAIAPNMDLTLNPLFSTKRGILGKATWRHRTTNGSYKVDLAGIEETDQPEGAPTDSKFRGSIATQGEFSLGSWWTAGWDATYESDDTFRRFYKLDKVLTTDRVSEAHLVGQSERSYLGAYLYHFGGLLATDNPNSESNALPSVDYHYVVETPVLGGELSFDANALSLSRTDVDTTDAARPLGKRQDRIIGQVNWRSQGIDGLGQVFTPFLNGRADLYQVGDLTDPADLPLTGGEPKTESVSRATGTVGLQYQFPFVARSAHASHVLEPVAQILYRPDEIRQGDLPNEDAQSLVFDDTLLFDLDKFSGYDRIETGTRLNAGLQYTVQGDSGGYVRAVVGQSYQLAGTNPFGTETGLDERESDYVAGLYIAPSSNIQFISQSRFDADTFELRREDASVAFTYGPIGVGANYALDRGTDEIGKRRQEQEILSWASVQLTQNWSTFGSIRYNLEDDEVITDSIGIKYANECVGLTVTYSESNVTDQDVKANQTVFVRLDLAYLGGTSFTSDAIGAHAAVEDRQN